MLRPYQQEAADVVKSHITRCTDALVVEAATGAGKSHIIADLADWVWSQHNGRVLCLAPSKELVEQNREKYLLTGNPASIFSASAGAKCMKHPVIFGSPITVNNHIDKFVKVTLVIIDECHGITKTIENIVEKMRAANPRLRVVGMTATPYRMNTGYIYALDQNNQPLPENKAVNPYFKKLVYKITARELIAMGFLTAPITEHREGYSTQHLDLNKMGQFDAREIEVAFEGHGRKTAEIVAQIVEMSLQRKGVMIFAATIHHAEEVLASLPSGLSELVTGKTPTKKREEILKRFKARNLKYLVNVSVLTTGFDATHVDVIAILRATESAGLLQQVIGRGLRIDPGKRDCLVLDYAENFERHCPDGDVFSPEIKAYKPKVEIQTLVAKCPSCDTANEFNARPNPDGYQIDTAGYWCDLAGNRLEMPGHFGRRCMGHNLVAGTYERCDYRWTGKECPECGAENDIAARRCEACKCEIVDPNEKLRIDFQKLKKDPAAKSTDRVLAWMCREWTSNAGNRTLRIDYTTEYRTFSVWYLPSKRPLWHSLCMEVFGKVAETPGDFIANIREGRMPRTITVKKDRSGFFTVFSHGEPEDAIPTID